MSTAPHRLSSLCFEERLALEPLLLAFDQAWHERLLEQQVAQLPPPGHPHRRRGLLELIKIDLEQQRKRGRQAKVEAYLHFYPELGSADTVPAELLLAEYQVRRQFGETVELADFARRFPQQEGALRRLLERASVPPSLAPSPSGDTVNEVSRRSSLGAAGRTSESLPEQFGPYRVLKKLGEGGMGAVYLVHNTTLERREALKVSRLPEELSRRFFVEAQAAARTNHPNICQVYDFGEIDGVRYLTMECIEGGTLADLVRTGEPIPPARAAALVRSLALALEKTHEQKVYHRDLKPANVLLTKDGEPKITDFGLACLADESRHTLSGTIMGTPCYMAPEQARGEVKSLDHACDIYSLGIILYELLTGQVPFLGQPLAVMHQHISAKPQPPSALRPGVAPRLEAICLKALEKTPAERHASMGDFARMLESFLSGEPCELPSQTESTPGLSPDKVQNVAVVGETPVEVTQPIRQRMLSRVVWVSGIASVIAVLLLATVFQVMTQYGTIHIEVDDPNVTVEVDGNEVTIKELGETIQLKVGEHGFTVKRGDLVIETRKFKIERGKNQALKVHLSQQPRPNDKQPEEAARPPDALPRAEPVSVGWKKLFDGESLSGWNKVPQSCPTKWSVANGVLVGEGRNPCGIFRTANLSYRNYILRCETDVGTRWSHGLLVRCCNPSGRPEGYCISFGSATCCGVYHWRYWDPTQRVVVRPPGLELQPRQPIVVEVRVVGNSLEIKANGKAVGNTVALDPRFAIGGIALRSRDGEELRVRKLEIKELSD